MKKETLIGIAAVVVGHDQVRVVQRQFYGDPVNHKLNPNCPQLGTRQELLDAGILSDNFADYGIVAAVATQTQAIA